ncbi:transketolase family protein [Paenibacillus thalictri]|uniref:Transketolase family protein n=1 Tax=Paenibacillus thalictri TaxID=2527873 RepID=A0A4Q9DF64_9BACL|nr:transketolase C-terminal domain-containing protein [Paenibacillus thalictri]TBL69895.1 transketolase family protein [Paenibacillus thalictri]
MAKLTLEKTSMRDVFGEVILELAKSDPKVYALDGDLANSTKINTVAEQFPEKFLQMGIAEQNMMGVAAGMASAGLQPWIATFAAFLTKRSLDQISVVVAQPKMDVKMIGAYSGLLNGCAGKTHQAVEDVAIMRSLPNMAVIAPGDTGELKQAMQFANRYKGPVYIRVARDPVARALPEEYTFMFGKAVKLREGSDVAIITSGTQTGRSLCAAAELEKEGISAIVLHVPTIKPLDVDAIIAVAKQTGAVVTAEEHSIIGGLGGAVAETLAEHYPVPVLRVGVEDINIQSGSNEALLDRYGLSSRHVVRKVKEILRKK